MAQQLTGKRVAILAADMVEEAELAQPRQALLDAGAHVEIVSLELGEIRSFHDLELSFGDSYPVDLTIGAAQAGDYDALFLPGGVGNPDRLRISAEAVGFVREFVGSGKPVGVICHGPWTLIEADVLTGRTITSWPSLRTDIGNAGGTWVDDQVVVDGGLVSSRNPDDLPAFIAKLTETIAAATAASPAGAS